MYINLKDVVSGKFYVTVNNVLLFLSTFMNENFE